MRSTKPIAFKWRHFQGELILQCVRWYCKYGISYRDLEEMMDERGLKLDHSTIYRWVQHYAPELKQRLEWYKKRHSRRWHLDETYIKIIFIIYNQTLNRTALTTCKIIDRTMKEAKMVKYKS